MEFDVLISQARVIDGTGDPAFAADVGLRGSSIVAVGELSSPCAREIIDAQGLVLSPGFIDIHSHSDIALMTDPRACSKLLQGVTTEVIGQCGLSAAPLDASGIAAVRGEWGHLFPDGAPWENMEEYLLALDAVVPGVNVVPIAGHGNIRRLVMGEVNRAPSAAETGRMGQLLLESLEAGAFGMSSGLIYPPGMYAERGEMLYLATLLAERGALYFTHMRNEEDQLESAVAEALDVARVSGVSLQISHLKAVLEMNWGKVGCVLEQIDELRAEGYDVMADQYPYAATATSLSATLPAWAHEGGRERLLERLSAPKTRDEMSRGISPNNDWSKVYISSTANPLDQGIVGQSISEIARQRAEDPRQTVMDLVFEAQGNVGMVRFGMSEDDIEQVMIHDAVLVGSDGSALCADVPHSQDKPHPRSFGTFPRVLGHYARDRGIIALEMAVAKMTGRTAERLGLKRRGLIAEGYQADLVLWDPVTIADRATFVEPYQYPAGIPDVWINGQRAVCKGQLTSLRAGQVLRRDS